MATLGRPRDPAVADAAAAAAVALIAEEGYANLTMERISERAGVSKAALYRRWPNKLELVVDAIGASARRNVNLPDTGRVAEDVIAFLEGFSRERQTDVEAYDALAGAVDSDPELAERCRDVLGTELAEAFRVIVGRGVARGELPAATDVDLLAEVVPALIRYRRQRTGAGPDRQFVERVVDQFFR